MTEFESKDVLTREIYSVFAESFPYLFEETPSSDSAESDAKGDVEGEGENEGEPAEGKDGGSPAKASPSKSAEEGEEGEAEAEAEAEASPEKVEEEEVDVYEEKIEVVNKSCEDFVAFVSDLEAHLRDSQQKAQEDEQSSLTKADKLYTPQWRDSGLPEMPSFLSLSEEKLESMNLLNPHSLWETIITVRDMKSAPPRTIEYFDNEAKGYLKTTNNLKVRSGILEQYPKKVTYKSFLGLTDEQLLKKARESENRLKELSKKMSAAQWDEEVKILQRMKQKLNYTRNPRYVESKKRTPKKEKMLFRIEPDNIEFQDYELGGMYSMQVRIRNISGLSRRSRFLPPRSKYFSIANVHFPGTKNLLAPGMCCKCELYFMPDSLADYDDFFSIETDVDTFQVQIAARRPSPNLSVPKSFDCGPCLLGHSLVTEFHCKNSGGRGSFKVVGEEDWPGENIDVSESEPMELAPFTFEPSSFKLFTGDDMTIKISFFPQESGNFVRNFKMLCDNCKIETFSIVGLGVKLDISLESINGKSVVEEKKTTRRKKTKEKKKTQLVPYHRKVWFGEVVPGAKDARTIVVRNNTPIPLAYHWLLKDNSCKRRTTSNSQEVFQISPMSGVLGARENSEFVFVFEPEVIENYLYCAQLMIESHSHTSEGSLLSNVIELELEGSGKGVDIKLSPAIVEFNGTMLFGKEYERDVTLVNRSKAPAVFSWKNVPPNIRIIPLSATVPPEDAIECDIIVMASELGRTDITVVNEIEHGPRLPLRVVYNVDGPKVKFLAPQVDFGLVEETKEVNATFELQNTSDTQAEFLLEEYDLPSRKSKDWTLTFSETSGVLEPNETRTFTISCTCSKAQALRTIVSCKVLIGDFVCSEQKISVRADVVAPLAYLSATELDIGVTYLNVSIERTVHIHNLTKLPCEYCWLTEDLLSEEDQEKVEIIVSPPRGTIGPGKVEEFDIEIIPIATGKCSVILPCEVMGMKEPLGLQINTEIEGISVKYEIKHGNDVASVGDSFCVDFGNRLPIGKRATMTLIVHNQSAIQAPVDMVFETFGMSRNILTVDQQSQSMGNMGTGDISEMLLKSSDMESMRTVRKSKRKVQMSKTLTANKLESVLLSDSVVGKLDSKLGQDRDKSIMNEAGNRGITFLATPSQGTLEPWGSSVFQISCVNNMCGTYYDTLHCDIGGLPTKPIPVKAGIVGSPLALQPQAYVVEKSIDNRALNLNWGEICMNSAAASRKFWVSNTSPFDVKVDWTVSLLGEAAGDSPVIVGIIAVDGKAQVTIEEKGKIIEEEYPFLLSPKSLLIPAGSVKAAKIEFKSAIPKTWKAVVRGLQSIQLKERSAVGVRIWDNKNADEEEVGAPIIGTFHPFAAPPCEPLGILKLGLTAKTTAPSLDTHDLERLDFVCHSCVPASDPSYKKSVTFTNTQSTTVMCRLSVDGPYKLISATTSYPQLKKEKEDSDKIYIIPPSENVDITVQYEKSKLSGEPEGLHENIKGLLKIMFLRHKGDEVLNKDSPVCVQSFPMRTKLLYPKIDLSADNINFANVHPNAPKVMELTLINSTVVDATWSICEFEEKKTRRASNTRKLSRIPPPKKETPIFGISPTSGVIKGCGIGQPNKQKITLTFHPQHDLEYKRQYRVKVNAGLGTFFALKGSGSYNEVLESDLALELS